MIKNRIAHLQPDYIFAIVIKPAGWEPTRFDEVPPGGKIASKDLVASYEEANDDLVRCNKASLDCALDTWAVILSPEGGL